MGLARLGQLVNFISHTVVVGFTAGSATDVTARLFAQKFTEAWGQPVVVENIAGNSGAIGVDRVAKAAADGTTLLMGHNGTLAVNPALYPKLAYDPLKSLAPVAGVARVPNVLVNAPKGSSR